MSSLTPVTVDVAGQLFTLDWQLRHDEKSLAYKIEQRFDYDRPLRNRVWNKGITLDQGTYRCRICGQFGACVGYSTAHMLASTPRAMYGIGDVESHIMYHQAKKYDQWAGEGYEGSSVLGSMQYLRKIGVLREYFWATTLREMQVAVSNWGPMVIGVDWHRGMFYPDDKGFIAPTGPVEGGHAIEVIGNSVREECFILPNTWGLEYGIRGTVKIRWEHMAQLIDQRGEFALPRKARAGQLVLPDAA